MTAGQRRRHIAPTVSPAAVSMPPTLIVKDKRIHLLAYSISYITCKIRILFYVTFLFFDLLYKRVQLEENKKYFEQLGFLAKIQILIYFMKV